MLRYIKKMFAISIYFLNELSPEQRRVLCEFQRYYIKKSLKKLIVSREIKI